MTAHPCRLLASGLLVLLLASSLPARGETIDLTPYVKGALDVYNELSEDPLPELGPKQIRQLVEGDVVKIRRKQARGREQGTSADRHERVVGYIIVHQPRRMVWLAALDPQFKGSDLLTEYRIRNDGVGGSLWYQHLSLPWPISDRHWVIRLWKSRELAEKTEGRIWEQNWDLADQGEAIAREVVGKGLVDDLDLQKIEKAIYTPVNHGSWTLFALTDDETLVAYRVSTVVGGSIPESWIATFAMAQLSGLLRRVAKHSVDVAKSYDPAQGPIYGGDGVLIPVLSTSR